MYSLQEQVHLCFARLDYLVARLRRHIRPETSVKTKVKVTLMGHSVGAYIALEMVRLWHERERRQHGSETDNGSTTGYIDLSTSASNTTPRPRPHSIPNPTRTCTTRPYPEWSIPSAILLTPTIQDLHLSSSGRIATPLLTYLPFLPLFAQSIVSNVLTALLPRACLVRLVQSATGTQPGSHGLEATMAFLESRSGVRQALEMAACELREIRAERWGEEVWGASHHDRVDRLDQRRSSEGDAGGGNRSTTTVTSPRLFFWFAKQDHWVADVTREEILRERGRGRGGLVERTDHLGEVTGRIAAETPTAHFRIDETDGLVHAWCLTQSELVAKRVGPWLRVGFDEEERGGGRGTAQRETC
ncbi:MAG: hypothetical protein DI596_04215 [Azospira oryzae]|nr:MAG: hypothetical protein DI596_04215 [Azospira oryzae]PZP81421.1 MAG: hypothetical protein DI593_04215 [Azospira oryzae]